MNTMPYKRDPQKHAPPGWEIKNIHYLRLLTLAQRTGCKPLIAQVKALKSAPRSDIVLIMEQVARAAKGEIDPTTLDLQKMITERTEKGCVQQN